MGKRVTEIENECPCQPIPELKQPPTLPPSAAQEHLLSLNIGVGRKGGLREEWVRGKKLTRESDKTPIIKKAF